VQLQEPESQTQDSDPEEERRNPVRHVQDHAEYCDVESLHISVQFDGKSPPASDEEFRTSVNPFQSREEELQTSDNPFQDPEGQQLPRKQTVWHTIKKYTKVLLCMAV
jgi:hypothetical protein